MRSHIFNFDNIGELYEIGLAYENKISKKQLGQYYTPKDTCLFMAHKVVDLYNSNDDNLADVCCGTGNLIIEVLSILGDKEASSIIKCGKLFLYDLDQTAISIAIMKIVILFIEKNDKDTFGRINDLIHVCHGNFLSNAIHLEMNTIVISIIWTNFIMSTLGIYKCLITVLALNRMGTLIALSRGCQGRFAFILALTPSR